MRLVDFQEEVVSRVVRYALPVANETGEETHELLIVGREQQVRETLAESEIEVTIRPGVTEEKWKAEAQRQLFRGPGDSARGFRRPKGLGQAATPGVLG
jgi:hypothetical protein